MESTNLAEQLNALTRSGEDVRRYTELMGEIARSVVHSATVDHKHPNPLLALIRRDLSPWNSLVLIADLIQPVLLKDGLAASCIERAIPIDIETRARALCEELFHWVSDLVLAQIVVCHQSADDQLVAQMTAFSEEFIGSSFSEDEFLKDMQEYVDKHGTAVFLSGHLAERPSSASSNGNAKYLEQDPSVSLPAAPKVRFAPVQVLRVDRDSTNTGNADAFFELVSKHTSFPEAKSDGFLVCVQFMEGISKNFVVRGENGRVLDGAVVHLFVVIKDRGLNRDAAFSLAVRAALSRIGAHYVWVKMESQLEKNLLVQEAERRRSEQLRDSLQVVSSKIEELRKLTLGVRWVIERGVSDTLREWLDWSAPTLLEDGREFEVFGGRVTVRGAHSNWGPDLMMAAIISMAGYNIDDDSVPARVATVGRLWRIIVHLEKNDLIRRTVLGWALDRCDLLRDEFDRNEIGAFLECLKEWRAWHAANDSSDMPVKNVPLSLLRFLCGSGSFYRDADARMAPRGGHFSISNRLDRRLFEGIFRLAKAVGGKEGTALVDIKISNEPLPESVIDKSWQVGGGSFLAIDFQMSSASGIMNLFAKLLERWCSPRDAAIGEGDTRTALDLCFAEPRGVRISAPQPAPAVPAEDEQTESTYATGTHQFMVDEDLEVKGVGIASRCGDQNRGFEFVGAVTIVNGNQLRLLLAGSEGAGR